VHWTLAVGLTDFLGLLFTFFSGVQARIVSSEVCNSCNDKVAGGGVLYVNVELLM